MANEFESSVIATALAGVFASLIADDRSADPFTIAELLGRLSAASDSDPMVLAAAVGGAWAALSKVRERPDDETLGSCVQAARVLASEDVEGRVVLGATALALLTEAAAPGTSAGDLVFAAARTRSVERHRVGLRLAKSAAARETELSDRQAIHAALLIALLDRDADVSRDAVRRAFELPVHDPVRSLARQLREGSFWIDTGKIV